MILHEDLKFLQHFGKKGMKWGVRKEKTASSGSSGSAKPQKLSRKEKKQAQHAVTIKRGENLVNLALKEPKSLILLNRKQVVTGKEFVSYLSKGGLLDIDGSGVYARQLDGPNKQYTMTDRDGNTQLYRQTS